jgi:hypothetical protein
MKNKPTSWKTVLWSIIGFKAFLFLGYYGLKNGGMFFVTLVPIAILILVGIKYSLSQRMD